MEALLTNCCCLQSTILPLVVECLLLPCSGGSWPLNILDLSARPLGRHDVESQHLSLGRRAIVAACVTAATVAVTPAIAPDSSQPVTSPSLQRENHRLWRLTRTQCRRGRASGHGVHGASHSVHSPIAASVTPVALRESAGSRPGSIAGQSKLGSVGRPCFHCCVGRRGGG